MLQNVRKITLGEFAIIIAVFAVFYFLLILSAILK